MSEYTVVKSRIFAGIWEGLVTDNGGSDEAPHIEISHLEQPVRSFSLTKDPTGKNVWQLRVAIPPDLLSDGVQVFLISDKNTGEKLNAFTLITGEPLEDDLRAEMELLRAELDMLKRAFRRHCLES